MFPVMNTINMNYVCPIALEYELCVTNIVIHNIEYTIRINISTNYLTILNITIFVFSEKVLIHYMIF